MSNFSDRLKELRTEKGILQRELADHIKVSRVTITQYENGSRSPDDEIKKKIAEYFNVSLDYLMGASDIRNPYKEEKYAPVDDIEEAMKIILAQPGLMLKGELLSDESKIILANAIQMGLRTAEELEKKKNKGDVNE